MTIKNKQYMNNTSQVKLNKRSGGKANGKTSKN
jgi:hypothetical protein